MVIMEVIIIVMSNVNDDNYCDDDDNVDVIMTVHAVSSQN